MLSKSGSGLVPASDNFSAAVFSTFTGTAFLTSILFLFFSILEILTATFFDLAAGFTAFLAAGLLFLLHELAWTAWIIFSGFGLGTGVRNLIFDVCFNSIAPNASGCQYRYPNRTVRRPSCPTPKLFCVFMNSSGNARQILIDFQKL